MLDKITNHMKFIPITKGESAIVDDVDYDELSRYKWHYSGGYARRRRRKHELGTQHGIFMHHHLIKPTAGFQVDHINCDRLDNRRENLRIATQGENQWNRTAYRTNQLGVKRVDFSKGKYRATIGLNGKQIHLGMFSTIAEASAAYRNASNKFHGTFSRV